MSYKNQIKQANQLGITLAKSSIECIVGIAGVEYF